MKRLASGASGCTFGGVQNSSGTYLVPGVSNQGDLEATQDGGSYPTKEPIFMGRKSWSENPM